LKLEGIVISEESFNSDDEYAVIKSNIDYVNALLREHVYTEELSNDALISYYVDYYLAQINNGGFSQFVYNSKWEDRVVSHVKSGLREMGATLNLELFNESAKILDEIGSDRIDEYLDSEYFGTNEERDILNAFSDKFYELQKSEDLVHLNSQWFLSKYIERIVNAIPDRDSRAQKALNDEPRFKKLIRALSIAADHQFDRVTAGSPIQYKGTQVLAWHFLTDKGHHYMIDVNLEAIMFEGESETVVTTIPAGVEYGEPNE